MSTQVKRERSELEKNMISSIIDKKLKLDKEKVANIKRELAEYKILEGNVQKWINNPKTEINKLTDDELMLFSEQVYIAIGVGEIEPTLYYTPREIKEIKTTFVGYETEEIRFPYTFENAEKFHDGWYVTVTARELRLLNNGKEIQYNPNTQRSSKVEKLDDGSVIPKPIIYMNSVNEIANLYNKGKLKSSLLIFNARLGSADDGEKEVYFDEENKTLTISKGTMFDCLDGYHRLLGMIKGQNMKPDVDLKFKIKIINVTEKVAKEHFIEINTTNKIHKAQMNKMDQSKFENMVAEYIQENSELEDKIVSDNTIPRKSDKVVSFSILSDAIKENFKIKNRGEAIKISRYMTSAINELCYAYPNEFLGDVVNVKDVSIINSNIMFYGYVSLLSKMYQNNIPEVKFVDLISDIDFSRSNSMWMDLGILDKKGNIVSSRNVRNLLKEFFETKL